MRRLRWVGLALVATASACDLLSTAPSSGGADLRISLDVVGAGTSQGGSIVSDVDQLKVTFTRPDGHARDTTVAIQKTAGQVHARVRLLPEELVDSLEVTAALERAGEAFYVGTATVNAGRGAPPTATVVMQPLAYRISVEPDSLSFDALGEFATLQAVLLFPSGDTADVGPSWSSEDPDVARVKADGEVTALANGDAIIDVSFDTVTAQVKVHVHQVAVSVSDISPNAVTLAAGASSRFTLRAWDRQGNLMEIDPIATWSVDSAGSKVAAVASDGLTLGLGAGATSVSASIGETTVSASVQVTAAGPLIALADTDGLHLMDLAGNRLGDLVSGTPAAEPTWAPDRSHVAYVSQSGWLWQSDMNGNTARIGTDSAVSWPEYSADGAWIYYGSGGDIYRIHPDGSGRQLITVDGSEPTSSPDGSNVAWIRDYTLMVQPIGGAPGTLDPRVGSNSPAWSPDSEWIAYLDEGTITFIHPDGTDLRRVPVYSLQPEGLSWSPDGKWLFGIEGSDSAVVVDPASLSVIRLPWSTAFGTAAWGR
jgi:sugar lactone lactonase YvrE